MINDLGWLSGERRVGKSEERGREREGERGDRLEREETTRRQNGFSSSGERKRRG